MNKNKSETIIYRLDELDSVVEKLIMQLKSNSIMTFNGPLGAGKTTLIREILYKFGVTEPVTSPTFNYVNAYVNVEGVRFYHFDLYRIESLDSFCQAGFDEYLYQPQSWSFIEWPELIMPLLDHDVCHVKIEYYDHKRKIHF